MKDVISDLYGGMIFVRLLHKRTTLHIQKSFRVAAIPLRLLHNTHVPETDYKEEN